MKNRHIQMNVSAFGIAATVLTMSLLFLSNQFSIVSANGGNPNDPESTFSLDPTTISNMTSNSNDPGTMSALDTNVTNNTIQGNTTNVTASEAPILTS